MTPGSYVPERGDVVWIDFDPQARREQAGRRPALVLSPADYNQRTELMLCCPITNQAKGYTSEVRLPDGLGVTGVVLADQAKSQDWIARRARFMCLVPAHVVDEVLDQIVYLVTS